MTMGIEVKIPETEISLGWRVASILSLKPCLPYAGSSYSLNEIENIERTKKILIPKLTKLMNRSAERDRGRASGNMKQKQ